jgi:hypothetical protein
MNEASKCVILLQSSLLAKQLINNMYAFEIKIIRQTEHVKLESLNSSYSLAISE